MFRIKGLLCIISLFSLVFICNSLPNSEAQKKEHVNNIVKKVSKLSWTFGNSPTEEKSKILRHIETKIKKSAKSLGSKKYDKYVNLLLKGVATNLYTEKIKQGTFEDDAKYEIENKRVVELTEKQDKVKVKSNTDHIRGQQNKASEPEEGSQQPREPTRRKRRRKIENLTSNLSMTRRLNSNNSLTQEKLREKLINSISEKLRILVNAHIKGVADKKAKQEAIELIKEKFRKIAEHGNQLGQNNSDIIKTYTDLIGKGVQALMYKHVPSNLTRRMETNSDDIFVDKSFNRHKDNNWSSKPNSPIKDNKHGSLNNDHNSKLFKLDYVKDTKLNISCEQDISDTCSRIKLLNTFTCEKGQKVMHISKMCDGNVDCDDSSDEVNCVRQALKCVQKASRVLSHIDTSISQDCYRGLVDSSFLTKQSDVFRKLLEKQLDFLQLHTVVVSESSKRRVFNVDSLKNSINEVTNVVNALANTLDATACGRKVETGSPNTPSGKRVKETSKIAPWLPEICNCIDQNCIKPCSDICEDICGKKYSLSRFQCPAANGDKNVALDVVCDGKIDCIDETDEDRCFEENSVTKYEATEMYNHILKLILDKTSSSLFGTIRNDLISLYALVTKLQKLTLAHYDRNVTEVKRVRESCFKKMTSIYSNSLRLSATPEETVIVYIFLLTLNEKLISAMKRSHIGNDKIIWSKDCVCRGYVCATPRCSESCKRVCAAEPHLTRYFCRGSMNINNTVPIEHLCNGLINCPAGDDEENCKKEVCRSHHLKLLSHNIRDAGDKFIGTTLGEALITWRKKAVSTFQYNEVRPTRTKILEVLSVLLDELVLAYGSLKDYRRDNSKAFDEFRMWSQVVMDGARACV